MWIKKGIKLLEEQIGGGDLAVKGDHVIYHLRMFLSKGEEIPINSTERLDQLPKELVAETPYGRMINNTCILGRRQALVPVETALTGMKVGGYRKIRVSPHLAYRDTGLPGVIPPNAVLTIEIWLCKIGYLT